MLSRYSFAKSLSVFAFAVLGLTLVSEAFAGLSTFQKQVSPFNKACSYKTAIPGWTLRVANVCNTTTVGGAITYISHHDKAIRCTWAEANPGLWTSEPGVPGDPTRPMRVTQDVVGNGNYAVCSGWDEPTNPAQPQLGAPPNPFTPGDHATAPYGYGSFMFSISYESTSPLDCEDPGNAGIGNNCGTFTDLQNKNHPPSTVLSGAANRSCVSTLPGTVLTYTFACGTGVSVTGYLTLVPPKLAIYAGPNGIAETTASANDVQVVGADPTKKLPRNTIVIAAGSDGEIDTSPSGDDVLLAGVTQPVTLTQPSGVPPFTSCTAERVAAGKCTMVLGGLPLTKKGSVDITACNAIFKEADVANALDFSQTQSLAIGQLLKYTEVTAVGSCDVDSLLPTDTGLSPPEDFLKGIAKEAYGRYCQSDIGPFKDNKTGNIFLGESTSTAEGFDNELRICGITTTQKVAHTGDQDVEKLKLGVNEIVATQDNQTTMNISCQGAGGNDMARVQITIPDQSLLRNTDVQISPPPTLEGVPPVSVTQNFVITDPVTLVQTFGLRLEYRRCGDANTPSLAQAIRDNNVAGTNPVILHLSGKTVDNPALSYAFDINNTFSVNVNGW